MKLHSVSAKAARTFVEADRSHVDGYYLAKRTGVAPRYVAVSSGAEVGHLTSGVSLAEAMDGDAYERWVAGTSGD